eukprot:CAMPEP_0177603426 /NCGR_PEP_ID=MMETSP0419_2-20121207/15506_1 /TAXON_ID=582737 /ORGANISM="Tetraselmis sp., Strain GSL018" /LENGTH=104 /DNA_ID=CAMNT_0019097197 /DNA_START=235 /DNA_END=549 /DNA_ORIENTATION=-
MKITRTNHIAPSVTDDPKAVATSSNDSGTSKFIFCRRNPAEFRNFVLFVWLNPVRGERKPPVSASTPSTDGIAAGRTTDDLDLPKHILGKDRMTRKKYFSAAKL